MPQTRRWASTAHVSFLAEPGYRVLLLAMTGERLAVCPYKTTDLREFPPSDWAWPGLLTLGNTSYSLNQQGS